MHYKKYQTNLDGKARVIGMIYPYPMVSILIPNQVVLKEETRKAIHEFALKVGIPVDDFKGDTKYSIKLHEFYTNQIQNICCDITAIIESCEGPGSVIS